MRTTVDTIYALSSGSGKAGVAIVRVSGPEAATALRVSCGRVPAARVAERVSVSVSRGTVKLDEAIALWFPGPGSFTGENVAEFHLHGSVGIVRLFLAELGSLEGCRPAEPGEFTRRALSNGKMDLVGVEGLNDMLAAETATQVKQALFHVDGSASEIFHQWRDELIDASGLAEACIDFTDEEGVADAALPNVRDSVVRLIATMTENLKDSERGHLNRAGVRVVLAGSPNVGKSSLLNAIAARDVAIVSSEAGTTRDVVEVSLDLGGTSMIISDTAGLRDRVDSHVEQLGIDRTLDRLSYADIVISVASPEADWQNTGVDSPTLRIWNKSDMAPLGRSADCDLEVSALTGEGVEDLIDRLTLMAAELAGDGEPALLVRERQVQAVKSALAHLEQALQPDLPIELLAEELRRAARDTGRLIGEVGTEDLLDSIFSKFCIGK
ncbi:MAG: tRNA uridine-5-carboxymethylaminomethyl(34) synthesis GTPase MnmE [Anderseniella sp.]